MTTNAARMTKEAFQNKISVVITTFNQEKTISRAIDSVLHQICPWPIEIIIGDDCSTDTTTEICRRYTELYPDIVRLYINKKNKGVIENYFSCLLRCDGKYIADLAGDDEWCDNNKLSLELQYLEQHNDVVLVHTDYNILHARDGVISHSPSYPFSKSHHGGEGVVLDIVSQQCRPVAHLCTSLYRNDAFRRCYYKYPKYFTGNFYPCEDVQLTMLMALEGKFAFLPCVTLNYSVTANSISNKSAESEAFTFKYRVFGLMTDIRDDINISHSEFSSSCQFRIHELLMHIFRLYDKSLFDKVMSFFHEKDIVVLTLRNKLLIYFLSCPLLWRILLKIRAIKTSH